MSIHQLKTGEPVSITPAKFFNDVVPSILTAQKDVCAKVGGSYGVRLFGENGGEWTLNFADASVNTGVADELDFYLEMDATDFNGMMKGTLDLQAAAVAGKIRFDGDASKFSNLAAVLKPAEA